MGSGKDKGDLALAGTVGGLLENRNVRKVYDQLVNSNYEYEAYIDTRNRTHDTVREAAEEDAAKAALRTRSLEEDLGREIKKATDAIGFSLNPKALGELQQSIADKAAREGREKLEKERKQKKVSLDDVSPTILAAVPPGGNTPGRG